MNIIKYTRTWFMFSGVMICLSIIFLIIFGLPLGIDFTGGTLMEVRFGQSAEVAVPDVTDNQQVEQVQVVATVMDSGATLITNKEVSAENIRASLDKMGADIGDPSVIKTGDNGYIIRIKDINDETHKALSQVLTTKFGEYEEMSFNSIGPTVGATLKEKALIAVIIAIIGIVLFIAYSFRKIPKRVSPWKFSLAAIVALVHDIIITVGIFSVLSYFLGYEANAMFITALLTILGYSVNDTIVVFDRIRENLKSQKKSESFASLANRSLLQTVNRSVNTSLTTLITLFALFFFGGETIKYFVLTLIIGFTSGTYSSIFIASPLLVIWRDKKFDKKN